MLCPQCGVTMKIVAVIDEAAVVDRILRHLARIGGNDPHEGTAQGAPVLKINARFSFRPKRRIQSTIRGCVQ